MEQDSEVHPIKKQLLKALRTSYKPGSTAVREEMFQSSPTPQPQPHSPPHLLSREHLVPQSFFFGVVTAGYMDPVNNCQKI